MWSLVIMSKGLHKYWITKLWKICFDITFMWTFTRLWQGIYNREELHKGIQKHHKMTNWVLQAMVQYNDQLPGLIVVSIRNKISFLGYQTSFCTSCIMYSRLYINIIYNSWVSAEHKALSCLLYCYLFFKVDNIQVFTKDLKLYAKQKFTDKNNLFT